MRLRDPTADNLTVPFRFPATKQDLLREARMHNDEPAVVDQLERIANRNYTSLEELIAALGRV